MVCILLLISWVVYADHGLAVPSSFWVSGANRPDAMATAGFFSCAGNECGDVRGGHGESMAVCHSELVAEGWGEFVSRYQWDIFATLTLANKFHRSGQETILKAFRWWLFTWERTSRHPDVSEMRWLNRRRRGKDGPVWVVGMERQQTGRLHLHAVIRFSRNLADWVPRYSVGRDLWYQNRGRGKIEGVRNREAVSCYTAKYAAKDGEVFFSDTFDAAAVPVSNLPATPF